MDDRLAVGRLRKAPAAPAGNDSVTRSLARAIDSDVGGAPAQRKSFSPTASRLPVAAHRLYTTASSLCGATGVITTSRSPTYAFTSVRMPISPGT